MLFRRPDTPTEDYQVIEGNPGDHLSCTAHVAYRSSEVRFSMIFDSFMVEKIIELVFVNTRAEVNNVPVLVISTRRPETTSASRRSLSSVSP